MSDELRAAAERRRKGYVGDCVPPDMTGGEKVMQACEDAELLANAYLAEHPASDSMPLTDAVFERLGFRRMTGYWRYKNSRLTIDILDSGTWGLSTCGGISITIPACRTVGEWRQLCERLGISQQPTTKGDE